MKIKKTLQENQDILDFLDSLDFLDILDFLEHFLDGHRSVLIAFATNDSSSACKIALYYADSDDILASFNSKWDRFI